MTQTNFDDVGDFHERFDLPSVTHDGAFPRVVDGELLQFRLNFLLEELTELLEACNAYFDPVFHPTDRNVIGLRITVRDEDQAVDDPKAFDALLDIAYVTFGMAHVMGYPWQQGWDLVQAANISKVRAAKDGSDSLRGSAFDVVKPEGWSAPDIEKLLDSWRARTLETAYVCGICGKTDNGCKPGYCSGPQDDTAVKGVPEDGAPL